MTLTVWRVEQAKYLDQVATGVGAEAHGGRWNKPGTPVVYCSASIALGMLEIVAGGLPFQLVEQRFVIPITFDENFVFRPDLHDLPKHWWTNPAPVGCQDYGTQWAESKQSAVLCVPSAVVDLELNFILNPEHPEFKKAVAFGKPVALRVDSRLRKK